MENQIVIIGSGNIAYHMALAFNKTNVKIGQIWSRNKEHAAEIASLIGCNYESDPNKIQKDALLYLICVSDSAIEDILKKIDFNGNTIAHMSGNTPVGLLKGYSDSYGVAYPLQSFTKYSQLDYKDIPFFVEGNDEYTLTKLKNILMNISPHVMEMTSKDRELIHLSAVFANNFTNHMYTIANELLNQNNFNIDILKPLIKETTQKILKLSPIMAQTGPAVRNNQQVIDRHIELLSNNEGWKKIYTFVTNSIQNSNNELQRKVN